MLYVRFDRFVVAVIVANARTLIEARHWQSPCPASFLSLLSFALLFSSLPWCPVHRPQDELTRIKMWKKGRSQRILLRTCREIVYSAVLRPKRARKKKMDSILFAYLTISTYTRSRNACCPYCYIHTLLR